MSNVDISRYSKRLVQLFWDPEPKNDDTTHPPIWCLGIRYEASAPHCINPPAQQATSQQYVPPDTSPDSSAKPNLESRNSSNGYEHVRREDVVNASAVNGVDEEWPKDFLQDFESRIWLTYRSNFQAIPKSLDPKANSSMTLSVRLKSQLSAQVGFTSDTGWGCMIRSGQSLLANALLLLQLGRGQHLHPSQHFNVGILLIARADWRLTSTIQPEEKRLLSLFADDPRAPFSIHNFVGHGAAACGTYPGQWFGPSATSKCIEALCNNFDHANLRVYVTGDGPDVFEDKLLQIAKGDSDCFRPTLLLVGTRLGIDRVTPVYKDALIASLTMAQSVGIAGCVRSYNIPAAPFLERPIPANILITNSGRPSSSHYFVGVQGSSFFYLDPHQTRPSLPFRQDPETYTDEEIRSFHTQRLRRLPVEEMDPSMLIAFLFRDEQAWKSWRQTVSAAPGKHIFHVADSRPSTYGPGVERESALDEVETLDDDDHEKEKEL